MSSSQLTTDSSGGASAVFTILAEAAGRMVKPKLSRLNSHSCPSASRKVICVCLSRRWASGESRTRGRFE